MTQTLDIILRKGHRAADLQCKDEGKQGQISGYAAVFDNVDAMGDIIRRGAFAKTIRERVKAGKVGLMVRHFASGGDTADAIGKITLAKEDEHGLYIDADLFGSQLAQETRAKIKEAPELFGMSIGYKVVKKEDILDEDGKVVGWELQELKLYEVTVTMMPANDLTDAAAKTELEALRQRVEALESKVPATTQEPQDTGDEPAVQHPASVAERMRREIAIIKHRQ